MYFIPFQSVTQLLCILTGVPVCKVPGGQRKSRFHIESSGAHGTGHILNATQNYGLREGYIEESKSYWLWININFYLNAYYYNPLCYLTEKKPGYR